MTRAALSLVLAGCARDVICAPDGHLCTPAGVLATQGFNGDGPAGDTMFFLPSGVAVRSDGRPVVADYNNMRVRVFDGEDVVTVVGSGVHAYAEPGTPSLGSPLENPIDVAFGPDGTTYLLEQHAGRVLRVDAEDRVQVVAGSGYVGFDGDGPATEVALSEAWGFDVAPDGTVYVADTDNQVIRAVSEGWMTTVAGVPGSPGAEDGVGGRLSSPRAVRWHDGALIVADTGNHLLRRLDLATGALTTLTAGEGPASDAASWDQATLREPMGLAALGDGSLVVADSGNHVIRRFDVSGAVFTLVGTGAAGARGDRGPCHEAELSYPADVAPDGFGGLWIADMGNGALRHAAGVLATPSAPASEPPAGLNAALADLR